MAISPCTYAVEHAEHPGTTLVVKTGHAHPSNWIDMPGTPVCPADVAESIHRALALGWKPSTPGSPFILNRPETSVSP